MCNYVIMELMGTNEYNDVRYRIGVEVDYEIEDGKIKLINPWEKVHYREVMGVFIYLDGVKGGTHVPKIDRDINKFKRVLDKLINDEEFNKMVYNHFFKQMSSYPEDVFEGIYYEFN